MWFVSRVFHTASIYVQYAQSILQHYMQHYRQRTKVHGSAVQSEGTSNHCCLETRALPAGALHFRRRMNKPLLALQRYSITAIASNGPPQTIILNTTQVSTHCAVTRKQSLWPAVNQGWMSKDQLLLLLHLEMLVNTPLQRQTLQRTIDVVRSYLEQVCVQHTAL